jgi:hypothetical protein
LTDSCFNCTLLFRLHHKVNRLTFAQRSCIESLPACPILLGQSRQDLTYTRPAIDSCEHCRPMHGIMKRCQKVFILNQYGINPSILEVRLQSLGVCHMQIPPCLPLSAACLCVLLLSSQISRISLHFRASTHSLTSPDMGIERRSPRLSSALPFHAPHAQYPQLLRPTLRVLKFTILLTLASLLVYILLYSNSITTYLSDNTYGHLNDKSNHLMPIKSSIPSPFPKIGKVTASFGPPAPIYESAIRTHTSHNTLHTYPSYILREQMLPGLWSKHAYLLSIIGSELAKPRSQRLDWLFWHDRDTLLMNPNIPLSIFLPPPGFEDVNLVVANDRNGLNNGVFFVRVGEWSFKMFASALSVREYEPGVVLKYSEQSAMEEVIRRVRFSLPLFSS